MDPIRVVRVVGEKQKLLDLLRSEEGNVDRAKVLAIGAVVGGSVLAQLLLAPGGFAAENCFTKECSPLNKADCENIGCSWACDASNKTLSCFK